MPPPIGWRSYLRSKNIGFEHRVGIMLERGIEMITAVLAVFKCGAVYVPLDAGYPLERLAYMIEDSAPSLILTETALENRLPWTAAEVVRLDEMREQIESESAERLAKAIATENGAYMIYTSGSTGKPKGVVVTHGGLEALAREQGERFGVSEGSRVLQFASLSFDASVSEIIVTLANGGALCITNQENLISGSALSQIIEQMNIEIATLPPALLSVISPDENWGLKTIIAAGEACNPKIVEKWEKGRRLLNAYGPTEATVCATIWEYDGAEEVGENVPIGKPIKNTEVYLLDEQMNPVPTGVAGEIYLGGEELSTRLLAKSRINGGEIRAAPVRRQRSAALPDGRFRKIFSGRADRVSRTGGQTGQDTRLSHRTRRNRRTSPRFSGGCRCGCGSSDRRK